MATSTAVEITNFLTEATRNKDVSALDRAFYLLRQTLIESAKLEEYGSARGFVSSTDLYLFCCEAAIGLGKWEMAKQCIIPVMQTGTTTKANEVRASYCRALIESCESKALRCEALVQSVVNALAKVVQGIRIALQEVTHLSQLVVLGTQHVWNICQPLFREGAFHTIVSAIGFAVFCLEAVEHADLSARSIWMVRYAVALNGAGKFSEAGAYISKVMEFVLVHCPQMRHTVFKVQVALTKQAPNPRLREGARGLIKHIYASQCFLSGMMNPVTSAEEITASWEEMATEVAARSGDTIEPAAPAQSNGKPTTAASPKGKATTTPRGKKGSAVPQQQASEAEKHEEAILFDETLGDIGLCLALLGLSPQAKKCSSILANSRSLQARVYGEYIAAWAAVTECGGLSVQSSIHLDSLAPSVESTIIETVRKIERSLQSAVRITDTHQRTHVVQHGVILMWNMALPLLQGPQRTQIGRSFQFAAKLLDDVQSNLNELRALLHYEGAMCDVDSDYLGKATVRLDKALGIDYAVSPAESTLHGADRPWDRFLVWARRSLEMRANVYQTPETPLDEALLIVEQSKDASIANRVSMLTKAEGILSRSEPQMEPTEQSDTSGDGTATAAISPAASPLRNTAGKSTPTGKKRPLTANARSPPTTASRDLGDESRRNELQHRAQLWHLILTYGWREQSLIAISVCRTAALRLLSYTWPLRGDRDMLVLQADAHLRLAEMRMAELSRQRLHLAQLKVLEESTSQDEGGTDRRPQQRQGAKVEDSLIEERMRAVSDVTAAVQTHIIAVCEISTRLIRWGYHEQWLLLNAAIFLWNAFLPSFIGNNFMGALEALQVVVPALLDKENRIDPQSETQLYQDLLLAYAKCLIQLFMVRKLASVSNNAAAGPNTATLAEVVAIKTFHDFSATDPSSTFLTKAWDVCDKAVELLRTPMDSKEFLMLTSTIRRFQGRAMDTNTRTLPQEKFLTVVDQLSHPSISPDERASLIKVGLDLLSQDPNVELCARFAEKAMGAHNKVAARAAIIGKSLCDAGKLGLKQNDAILASGRPSSANAAKKETREEASKGGKDSKKKNAGEAPTPVVEAPPVVIPPPSSEDCQWYALLLMYKGCVTASLLNPAVQDKTTQIEIRRQALVALADSVTYALRGSKLFATRHIMECYRHYRNIAQELAGDPVSRHFTYESLRVALCDEALRTCSPFASGKPNAMVSRLSDAEVVAQLLLLLLKVLADQKRADAGMAVMKTALALLPTNQHKPFWALDIQLRCEAGLSTAQTLLRVKEFSAEMQAQTYLALARHGKDKMDQLFAFQKAIELMQAKPVERAGLMLAMAQWALEANAPLSLSDVRAMILSAIDLAAVDEEGESVSGGSAAAILSRVMANAEANMSQAGGAPPMSTRGMSRQGPPSVAPTDGGASRKSIKSTSRSSSSSLPSIRQVFVAIEGYYLLSKIAPHSPETVDGVLVDVRTCLHMLVHYVMRAWALVAEAANSHTREAKAKWAAQEAKAAQLLRQQQAESLALREEAPPPPEPTGKVDKKMSKAAAAAAAAAAAQQQAQSVVTTLPKPERPNFPDEVVLPSTPQAWIGYSFPVALLSSSRSISSSNALNTTNIDNPDAIVALLRDSVESLVREGIEAQTPPLTALQCLLLHVFYPAETDTRIQTIELEATVKAWDVCYRLGAAASVGPYSTLNPIPAAEERAALAEDSALVQKHFDALAVRSETSSGSAVLVRPPSRSQQPIHHYWLSIATMLLREGCVVHVRELLAESTSHAKAHRDSAALARANYLEAQLAYLDGRYNESLEYITKGLGGEEEGEQTKVSHPPVSHMLLVDMCMLKATNALALRSLDDAFSAEAEAQQALVVQKSSLQGLAREVAESLVPEMQALVAVRFVAIVLDFIKKERTVSQALPPSTRPAGTTDVITTVSETLAALRGVVQRARFHTDACPKLRHKVLLAEVEVDRAELLHNPTQYSHKQLKARLQSQGVQLAEAISSLKAELVPGNEGSDSGGLSARSSAQIELSQLLIALGMNIAHRVQLNYVLVDELRASSFTRLAVPRMEGAPEELHKEVVRFMRSTAKMREATQRRKQREAIRAEIEARRAAIRSEKQRDVERLREQRKLDEAAAAAAVVSVNKRESKSGRAPSKGTGAVGRRKSGDALEVGLAPIPDVDPSDKCGIDSVHTSDDEGLGEDSQSDEEEELESALEGLNTIEEEIRLTYGNAFALFTEAAELAGASSSRGPSSLPPHLDPQFFVAAALRRVAEGEITNLDQRSAIVSGRDLPSLLESPTITRCWSLPIEVNANGANTSGGAVVGAEGQADDKNPSSSLPKGREESKSTQRQSANKVSNASKDKDSAASGSATSNEQQVVNAAAPLPEVRNSPAPDELSAAQAAHRIAFPNAPSVPATHQAIPLLLACASRAHSLGARGQLTEVLSELALVAAMQHNTIMAGQAIELAQASAASDYLITLWKQIGPQDTPEAALARLVDVVGADSPHLMCTQHYLGLLGLLQHYSPMHVRLTLPDPSTILSSRDRPATTHGIGPRGLPSQDTAVLTLMCVPTDYLSSTRLVAVLRRGTGQIDTRMITVSTAMLEETTQKALRIAKTRQQEVQQLGKLSGTESEAEYLAYVSEVSALLAPLLRPFAAAMQHSSVSSGTTASTRATTVHHLVLALHPKLLPLPLESLDVFAGCATISRDISLYTFQQRVIRKHADRYVPSNVQCMVDPFAENDDNSVRFVFGGLHPRAPLFSNTMTTVDSNRQLRPIQPHQVLRMFTLPTANSVLVDCGGRLASACPLEDLCGLQLDHVRAVFLFDRGVSSKAARRENEHNMNKDHNTLRHEIAFWVTPMLLLARGVDFVAANTMPTPVPFIDSLAHAAYNALEKPANFAEVLSAFVPRFTAPAPPQVSASIPLLADNDQQANLPPQGGPAGSALSARGATLTPSLPPIPQQKPSSRPSSTSAGGKAKEYTTISIPISVIEASSLKFFGYSPADEHTPQTAATGKVK